MRQVFGGVIEADGPSRRRASGGKRAVQGQHGKNLHVSTRRCADFDEMASGNRLGLPFRDDAFSVAAEGNLHRSILIIGIIEMDANEAHPVQKGCGGFAMPDTGLLGPIGEARAVSAGIDGDHPVLMPGDAPICGIALGKPDDPHQPGTRQRMAVDQRPDRSKGAGGIV